MWQEKKTNNVYLDVKCDQKYIYFKQLTSHHSHNLTLLKMYSVLTKIVTNILLDPYITYNKQHMGAIIEKKDSRGPRLRVNLITQDGIHISFRELRSRGVQVGLVWVFSSQDVHRALGDGSDGLVLQRQGRVKL